MKQVVYGCVLFIAVSSSTDPLCADSIAAGPAEMPTWVDIPLWGQIDAMDYSLPVLAVLLGVIDGFNPCAMWALVYLLSLVAALNDRRKIWLVVGTFVAASGILYFLFMTAWLNAFLFLGYFRPITMIMGILALFMGIGNIVALVRKGGVVECKIVGERTKEKTMSRMKSIVSSPVNVMTIVSMIGLAFIVNSIEFVCSCAIPAVFTHVLAISDLSGFEHYGYILLYDFFFMLDDLLIFASAAFAFNATIGNRYVVYCRTAGGLLLTGLGLMLVFKPHMVMM